MDLIAEISNKTFGLKPIKNAKYSIRRASRGVVLNKNDEVALIWSTKHSYYKLPGGGIEKGENPERALRREVLEEIGYKIRIQKSTGVIIEYGESAGIIQISYCFLSHVIGQQKRIMLTKSEKKNGMKLVWVKGFNSALKLIAGNKANSVEAKSMIKRDSLFIKRAKLATGKN